jgi:hypothetical protein
VISSNYFLSFFFIPFQIHGLLVVDWPNSNFTVSTQDSHDDTVIVKFESATVDSIESLLGYVYLLLLFLSLSFVSLALFLVFSLSYHVSFIYVYIFKIHEHNDIGQL